MLELPVRHHTQYANSKCIALTRPPAPIDSNQIARSVREDTAELASYALSDRASIQSTSPPSRRAQSQLESYFTASEVEAPNRELDRVRHESIQEVSEPVSPDDGPSRSPGTSALTDMLRKSSPNGSPTDHHGANDVKYIHDSDEDEDSSTQGRLIITSNGVRIDASERTPLLQKSPILERHHPDWIRDQPDPEDLIARKPSWPRVRNAISWPTERAYDIACIVFNPKQWDKKAIWENAVVAPLHNIPAVILGSELTVLDALSYGMYLLILSV